LFGKTAFKAQNDYIFLKFEGAITPLIPPGCACEYSWKDV